MNILRPGTLVRLASGTFRLTHDPARSLCISVGFFQPRLASTVLGLLPVTNVAGTILDSEAGAKADTLTL